MKMKEQRKCTLLDEFIIFFSLFTFRREHPKSRISFLIESPLSILPPDPDDGTLYARVRRRVNDERVSRTRASCYYAYPFPARPARILDLSSRSRTARGTRRNRIVLYTFQWQ